MCRPPTMGPPRASERWPLVLIAFILELIVMIIMLICIVTAAWMVVASVVVMQAPAATPGQPAPASASTITVTPLFGISRAGLWRGCSGQADGSLFNSTLGAPGQPTSFRFAYSTATPAQAIARDFYAVSAGEDANGHFQYSSTTVSNVAISTESCSLAKLNSLYANLFSRDYSSVVMAVRAFTIISICFGLFTLLMAGSALVFIAAAAHALKLSLTNLAPMRSGAADAAVAISRSIRVRIAAASWAGLQLLTAILPLALMGFMFTSIAGDAPFDLQSGALPGWCYWVWAVAVAIMIVIFALLVEDARHLPPLPTAQADEPGQGLSLPLPLGKYVIHGPGSLERPRQEQGIEPAGASTSPAGARMGRRGAATFED